MTRIELLQDQKAKFEAQGQQLDDQWNDIYAAQQKAVGAVLNEYFADFDQQVDVDTNNGSVYFKMDHPDYTYKKELFNVYLKDNWTGEGRKYSGVDISYYTTSTSAEDKFEMKRLMLLGKVAEIVNQYHLDMVFEVNQVVDSFKDKYTPINEQARLLRIELDKIKQQLTILEKEQVEAQLKGEGVTFTKGVTIQFKHNYSARVTSIKLTDFSKSGKKATAVYTWAVGGDHVSTEENVNVDRIIEQVLYCKDDIAKMELQTS